MKSRTYRPLLFILLITFLPAGLTAAPAENVDATITTPEAFFGFQMGSDRKMARWDRMVEYYRLLENQSDRIRVTDMGPSTMGNPFLLLTITSPGNLKQLDRIRETNQKISDPRGISEEEIDQLIAQGKAVICQSMSLHATEVGGSQMAVELAYDLAARTDHETQRILDNVVFLMFPSFNPDGQIMVTDWYRETLDTEYEGTGLPWLYHKYVGHDNNRDGDFLNMIESVYAAKVMYRDWPPQAYVDHHHMGSYGARFYVPPYSEPIRPWGDPLMWREISWFGSHVAYKLEEAGKSGVLNAAQYPGWGHFGWHWITPFHNIAGMLTESASARLATPLYIHPDQLRGGARAFPRYEAQSTIPNPWKGGWWRLRDIVEQQKISAWATLDMAARHRQTVLRNAYLKARRQTERGAAGNPGAYAVPRRQHDPLTAIKMINTLMLSGVEIARAESPFTVAGMTYQEGTYVVTLAQPKMGLIRNLLGRTLYPDNEWTRGRDGTPLRPYDSATHTMNEFMGVRVDNLASMPTGDFRILTDAEKPVVSIERNRHLVLDGRLNDSFKAVNLLLDRGLQVSRVDSAGDSLRAGDFIVSGGDTAALEQISEDLGLSTRGIDSAPSEGTHPVQRKRVGMYHRYRGGNMDEGWTRFLLETFAFPYTSVQDAEIQAGNLREKFDVLIFPHDNTATIMGEERPTRRGRPRQNYPPEYRSGLGDQGLEAIREFVRGGGTLVALGDATAFAIEKFQLPIRNVLANLDSEDFFCPGSTVRVRFRNSHRLAWGMPAEGLVLHWNSPAFSVTPTQHNDRYTLITEYADRDLLQSGWLIGEQHLAKKAGMIDARVGDGNIVLIGFRAQHRAQTHGTFKLFFNTLIE